MLALIGESQTVRAVREQIQRLLRQVSSSRRPPCVLLQGETGTGKGLVARALHRSGPRASGPFVDINCAAIPETLIEAELVGFEQGAFTDARHAKPGLFEAAHSGVIFLDEIGLLPIGLQVKLLNLIEGGAVRRLGSTRDRPTDVWVIAASNEDLARAVRDGRFREDLYHRIAGLTFYLPPLRERGDDIRLLAEHFLGEVCGDYGLAQMVLRADAAAALLAHPWPGNVRELMNVIERAALLSDAQEITAPMLGLAPLVSERAPVGPASATVRDAVESFEREQLLEVLQATGWNISFAADRLGIPRNTLRYRMARHDLRTEGPPPRRRRFARPAVVQPAPVTPDDAEPPAEVSERREVALLRARIGAPGEAGPSWSGQLLGLLVDKVQSFGGTVEELGPQGIVGIFGLEPIEDAPRRAAHAALAIQHAANRAHRLGDVCLMVAAAIHVMTVEIQRSGETRALAPESREPALAALGSLLGEDAANEVLVSSAAAAWLERSFQLEAATTPGGESGQIYRIKGKAGTGPGRGLTRFVGRDRELGLLYGQVEQLAGGRGQVVGIVGEPGAGKSRLLHEFIGGLTGRDVAYLEGDCLSHGRGVPYLPVIDLLRRTWALDDQDTPELLVGAVRRRLEEAGLSAEEYLPYLLRLFGIGPGTEPLALLSPEAVKRRTFDAVRQVILRRGGPVVLAIEDLHWVDKTTEELLSSVVDSVPGAPLLFVSTYRPGYRPPWIDRSYVSQLALAPLSVSDSRVVVHSILSRPEVSERVAEEIVTRGEGNPFFLEELALAVEQHGGSGVDATVPQTVDGVLTARLAQLPHRLRRVLQIAAVVGREVPFRLLDALTDQPMDLSVLLGELVRLEFLHEQAGAAGRVYGFKHALIQDVAYRGVAPADRTRLHLATGRALETLYADQLDVVLDRLAYHYSKTDDAPKAVTYLTRLAEKATASYSLAEAVTALEDALTHAERLDVEQGREDQALTVVVRLGVPLVLSGRLEYGRDLLLRYQDRLDRLQNPALAGPYYFLLCGMYDHLGDQDRAAACAHRSIEEAKRCGDALTLGQAYVMLAHGDLWRGELRQGVAHARVAIDSITRPEAGLWQGMAHWILAWNSLLLGELTPALEAGAQVRAIGERIADLRLQSYGSCIEGWGATILGDLTSALSACHRAVDLAPDPLASAVVQGFAADAHLANGDAKQAKPHLERALELARQFHMSYLECWNLCRLSEAEWLAGKAASARDLGMKALTITETLTFPYGRGLAQRALGRAAHGGGDLTDAAACLTAALETFSRIGARYEVARTQLDLAAALHGESDREVAASHLQEAHRIFAELDVPRYVERTQQLAAEYEAALPRPNAL